MEYMANVRWLMGNEDVKMEVTIEVKAKLKGLDVMQLEKMGKDNPRTL